MGTKLNTSEIIKRLKDKFGDKYDYSKVEYMGIKEPICITCPKHGEFLVRADKVNSNSYLCPKCGYEHASESHKKQVSKTTEQFIEEARKVHGDKYDYSKVEYVTAHKKVCIICPKHGEFWQEPCSHTNGQGCPKCGKEKLIGNNKSTNLTTEEFIEKARKKHGDKFDYSKVEYKDRKTEICIICPIHGEFYVTPAVHLYSSNGGCKKCRTEKLKKAYISNTKEFIEKAKEIHGDKYDYSKVEYVNSTTKVCIICPKHGEFWQTPASHLRGYDCLECGKIKNIKNRTKSTEQFIEEVRKVYGDKYDYSKVKYVNSDTKVCLICPKHGEFLVNPSHFLHGHGCPTCGNNRILTKENFILKAREVHGDKYDYSKVEYVNYNTPVCIICPIHGEFWETPKYHINSATGCRKCGVENVINGHMYTLEHFLEKSKEVHGDKYDYSKVDYVDTKTKVRIICPEHGEFLQAPGCHMKGIGCPKCYGRNKTTKEFIQQAHKVHGDKYDYSKVEYVKARDKVCIICPKHGEFWQTPYAHLKGGGCPKCDGKNRTTEEWIELARKVHGDKYDYSKVEYVNWATKVRIICPEHGEFLQSAGSHLRGNGCPKCKRKAFDTESFISEARKVHGNKYDYSNAIYTNSSNKICVICPEHGEFWPTAHNHLNGSGCPMCNRMTTEKFIERARKVHGNKYDYSKVIYKHNQKNVCIICPIHGEFWQMPHNHLRGSGCPICGHGYNKAYKFNLLEEFETEYDFRAFLANNDINILQVILRNLEPKYEPLKHDIEKALANANTTDPIKALEDKYTTESDDNSMDEFEVATAATVDLDNDNAIDEMVSNDSEERKTTIDEVIKNTEREIKVINKIEHMLTPEDREYIMCKFLNDKHRAFMLKREESVK